ncbi:MAG TPA: oligosaccharide flippase family protein [Paludibacteraceae bacterium]|nr:oligosaccharide flippase family protein [Paludibacteraceae bacterium]HQF49791.1 oligosaccharide flippase family protein [Paludibacteraceae bacterium]HQJ89245.1 oligosaccharide flippase family protein [Paludibacteraceae bacterium]
MAEMKNLAKDTAIYGLSSIVGRFLNYLLVPLYTAELSAASGGYGIITNVYAYTALIMVILTYGMETTFFRFANKEGENSDKVYGSTLTMVGFTSLLFIILLIAFLNPISNAMGYSEYPDYVAVMGICVAIDAFQCIPFVYLRYQHRPIKFAALKFFNVLMIIFLNLTYFIFLPKLNINPYSIYGADGHTFDVGWVFYINLFCTALIFVFFIPELKGFRHGFDKSMAKRMISYSWPVLILGVVGILNQTVDKILFPYLYKGADAHTQLGIYGAAFKIAMIMAMITQAFRYAYEPFVFGKAKDKDSKETYAKTMKYFIIFTLLAFLCVTGYLDILRYFIGKDYWEGLKVVPIVMAAEMMMGVYFNLSFWYKLIDKTIYGAIFSGIGCAVLVAVNIIFVPIYGYIACAWGGFAGYGICMLLSYFVGQKKYKIDYPVKDILYYVLITIGLFIAMTIVNMKLSSILSIIINTVGICVFLAIIVKRDMPLSAIPFVNRFFKK